MPLDDLSKVRDLLFGEQIRQLEQELQALRDELATTRQSLDERIAAEGAARDRQQTELLSKLEDLRGSNVSRSQFSDLLSRLATEMNGAHMAASTSKRAGAKDA